MNPNLERDVLVSNVASEWPMQTDVRLRLQTTSEKPVYRYLCRETSYKPTSGSRDSRILLDSSV